jgi:hypothetical protein
MSYIQRVVDTIEKVAREEIRKDFRADSCIASTRVVIRVLKHFGIEAQPFPVKLMVFNAAFVRQLELGNRPPQGETQLAAWCEKYGAWSVGVGFNPSDPTAGAGDPGYVGHLIAVLPTYWLAVDASADQADRPRHGINMPGVMTFPITPKFLNGQGSVFAASPDGAFLEYKPDLGNLGHRVSPDWNDKTRTKRSIKAIIRAVESSLESSVVA